jgi:hypothetical protein
MNNDVSVDTNGINDDIIDIDPHFSSFITFDCTEPHCIMQFQREDRLRAHLLLDNHKTISPPFRLLDKAAIIYKETLGSDNPKEIPILSATRSTTNKSMDTKFNLDEGWALFHPRVKVAFTPAQRAYLNQKYDEGEKCGAKWDAATVAEVSSF